MINKDQELTETWDTAYSQGAYEMLVFLEGNNMKAFDQLLEVKHFKEIWDHFTK